MSSPSRLLVASSIVDVNLTSALATLGFLMTPLPIAALAGGLSAATAFAFVLDQIKLAMFARFPIA